MKVKFTLFICLIVFSASVILPQGISNDIKIDTLKKYLRELSGNTQAIIDGNTYTITSRNTNNKSACFLAAKYIKNRLQSYGLTVTEQLYTFNSGTVEAKNIYAVQTGSLYPDKKYIICAHYDAVAVAPGANDNGSGTCAVLEAARVISKLNPKYTIMYALWSGEEQGLKGSTYYAGLARANSEDILGVINLDMIGDAMSNNVLSLYTVMSSNSFMIDNLSMVNSVYNINLPLLTNTTIESGSDHYPFYLQGYPSYLLIEKDARSDIYYHKATDAFGTINQSFYEKCSKLAILSLAELSGAVTSPSAVEYVNNGLPTDMILNQNYPNPFNPSTVISYSIKSGGNVNLVVLDPLGREIKTLVNEYKPAGMHQVNFSVDNRSISSGIYFYKLQSASSVQIKKMVYLK